MASPTKRGKTLYLLRHVPKRYARVDSRTFAVRSLHTDSEAIAVEKEPAVWNQIVAGWEAKLRGDYDDATVRFDAAKELAELRGFRFVPVSAVAKLPLAEKIERLEPAG